MFRRRLALPALFLLACSSEGTPPEGVTSLGHSSQDIKSGTKESGHLETASMIRSDPKGQEIEGACTVVFLTGRLALTAGHCVGDLSDDDGAHCDDTDTRHATQLKETISTSRLLVYTDEVLRDGDTMPATHEHMVSKVSVPGVGSVLCGKDLALVELTSPLDELTTFPPVRLGQEVTVGEKVTAVGYGADGSNDDVLRRRSRSDLSVVVVGESKNLGLTKSTATEWIVDQGPCGGDSGSPAFDEAGQLVGIMSRGTPKVCIDMVYSRVDEAGGLGAWIRDAVVEASTRTGDAVPAWAQPADTTADAEAPPDDSAEPTRTKAVSSSCTVAAPSPARTNVWFLGALASLVFLIRRRRS